MKKNKKLMCLCLSLLLLIGMINIANISVEASQANDFIKSGNSYYIRHHISGANNNGGGGYLTVPSYSSLAYVSSEPSNRPMWIIEEYLDGYLIKRDGKYLKYIPYYDNLIRFSEFDENDYELYMFTIDTTGGFRTILPKTLNGNGFLTSIGSNVYVNFYTGNETYGSDFWYIIEPFQIDTSAQYYIKNKQTGLYLHASSITVQATELNTNASKVWTFESLGGDEYLIKNGNNYLQVRNDGTFRTNSNIDPSASVFQMDHYTDGVYGIYTNSSGYTQGLSVMTEDDEIFIAIEDDKIYSEWCLEKVYPQIFVGGTGTQALNGFEASPFSGAVIKLSAPTDMIYVEFSVPCDVITASGQVYTVYNAILLEGSMSFVVIKPNIATYVNIRAYKWA